MERYPVQSPSATPERSTIDGIGGHAKPVVVCGIRYRPTSSGTAADVFATREGISMRFSVELLLQQNAGSFRGTSAAETGNTIYEDVLRSSYIAADTNPFPWWH